MVVFWSNLIQLYGIDESSLATKLIVFRKNDVIILSHVGIQLIFVVVLLEMF